MTLPIIGPADSIPGGTNVLCVWPTGAVLPDQDTLKAAVAPFGVPFVITYLTRDHVCVRVTGDPPDAGLPANGTRLGAALMGATGKAPIMLAIPSDLGDAVEIEITGENVREALGEMGEAIQDAAGAAGHAASSLPWLLAGAVLGVGLLAVGAALYLAKKKG